MDLHLLNQQPVSTETFEIITDECMSMSGFIPAKIIETFQSEEIANTVLYAIQTPKHVVNVNEILIKPNSTRKVTGYYGKIGRNTSHVILRVRA
jgi:NADP-dependent 3-hydroxy acid dehydrogenase YdfG